MSEIKIAIPSYKRTNKVRILDSIPTSHKNNTFLFTRPEEYQEYKKNYSHRCNVISLENLTCISDTRKAIINFFDNDRIWMSDDDNIIHRAEFIEEKNIIRCDTKHKITENEFYDCLSYMNSMMDLGYPHGLLRLNLFARNKNYWPHRVNCYGFTNVYFDLTQIDKKNIHYLNEVELLEDLYVFLSLVEQGYKNCMISKYMVSSSPANSEGGCSIRRNVSRTNNSVDHIVSRFPQFVKLKQTARYRSNNSDDTEILKGLQVRIPKHFQVEKPDNRNHLYSNV